MRERHSRGVYDGRRKWKDSVRLEMCLLLFFLRPALYFSRNGSSGEMSVTL